MTEITVWRKRPVEVSAVQWTGGNIGDVFELTGCEYFDSVDAVDLLAEPNITAHVFDKLHSTWVGVKDGQWIIRGVKGEFYPCDDDVNSPLTPRMIHWPSRASSTRATTTCSPRRTKRPTPTPRRQWAAAPWSSSPPSPRSGKRKRSSWRSRRSSTRALPQPRRSEERRVGKECRSRWSPYH